MPGYSGGLDLLYAKAVSGEPGAQPGDSRGIAVRGRSRDG